MQELNLILVFWNNLKLLNDIYLYTFYKIFVLISLWEILFQYLQYFLEISYIINIKYLAI